MRRWHEYLPWGALGLTVLLFAFLLAIDANSYSDRSHIHDELEAARRQRGELRAALEEERRKGEMTRRMLNARGRVQTAAVDALCRERVMTIEECRGVRELYGQAEYPSR